VSDLLMHNVNAGSTMRSQYCYDGPIVVLNIRCFLLWLVSCRVATHCSL